MAGTKPDSPGHTTFSTKVAHNTTRAKRPPGCTQPISTASVYAGEIQRNAGHVKQPASRREANIVLAT